MNRTNNKAITDKKDLYLIGLHIVIGLIAVIFPPIIPIYIVAAILIYILVYSINDKSKLQVLIFISYLTAMETLYRAAGVTFLPYELSKYIQIGLMLVSLIMARTRLNSFFGILIILLVLPSAILFPPALYKNFVFTSFGIIALGFFISFTGNKKIIFSDFVKIVKAFLFPCISFIIFITIKTPKFSEINFTLTAHSETTGGFGSNQVATLLGAAICFIIIMVDKKMYIGNRLITFSLMIFCFLRAFLSFSRGGIIGLILSVVISFILFKRLKQATIIKLGVMVLLFSVVFIIANNITGGALLLRYQGETTGTIAGTKDKNLETIASGRINYAEVDLAIWYDNLILGVGPGNSQFMRSKYELDDKGAPHTEATRLLAENGIFGLLINLLLLIWPIYIVHKTPGRDMKFIKSILFIFAYATTYHSAIRTGLTPLFYGLASMDISPANFRRKKAQLSSRDKKLIPTGKKKLFLH